MQKCLKEKKRTILSAVAYDSVVHKSKKRKEKKVELIDDLENKYEAKIARSHEDAETAISDVGAKKAQKRKKNQSQKIYGESHVEEKKPKLQAETGKHIRKFVVRQIEENSQNICKLHKETLQTTNAYGCRTCHDIYPYP